MEFHIKTLNNKNRSMIDTVALFELPKRMRIVLLCLKLNKQKCIDVLTIFSFFLSESSNFYFNIFEEV